MKLSDVKIASGESLTDLEIGQTVFRVNSDNFVHRATYHGAHVGRDVAFVVTDDDDFDVTCVYSTWAAAMAAANSKIEEEAQQRKSHNHKAKAEYEASLKRDVAASA